MTQVPAGFRGSQVDVTVEDVKALFPSVKRESGPGHPWVRLGKTKGEIMDKYGDMLAQATVDVLRKLGGAPRGTLPETPVELIRQEFSAPMRVFVKSEPHGEDKVRTGRLRLIIMVPVHLVLAEMLIFGTQNNEEISHWDEIPSKPGFGLSEDHQITKLWNEVKSRKETLAEADVSGFDFCLCEQFFLFDAERRVRLSGASPGSVFENVVYNMHHVMCRAVYTLSNGRMFQQLEPGVMKSGRYVTSSTNSFIRVMLARAIGSSWCIAMGDDSLESLVPDAVEKYKRLGINIKFLREVNQHPLKFEFCSHVFSGGNAWPSKPGKMLYNLLSQGGTTRFKYQQFQQWYFEMRHHPDVDTWVRAIERCGWATQNNGKQQDQEEATQCATKEENF